ncbi:ABC transporter permease [Breznakia sp. OttesenSCG-928-G09]|nr:ABC transporter permease [Breznakia sp. OttesenSCG-928-G09]
MFFKLAMQNVRKSYKDYSIYFLTLAFSVCLFFTFNSFQEQDAVMAMNKTQSMIMEQLSMMLLWLSFVVAIILGFLILYANNFLIKRRKKEFGLYTLLGMPKGQISRILVYETFIIGLLSLGVGILLGIGLSQILTIVTANLFTIPLNYHFVFSYEATFLTIIAFSIIFVVVMIFNTFVLNKYKLIDLLYADRKNDVLKIKNVKIYVLVFIVSIVCLGSAYALAWNQGLIAFLRLNIIVPLGLIGTFLFFLSLAGFLLRFVQTSKRIYFRNLNMFVLREVNSSIKSNFISMSFVCIMLLFSIGALATGFSLNDTINKTIESITPYDLSYQAWNYMDEEQKMDYFLEDLNIKENKDIESVKEISVYESDLDGKTLSKYLHRDEQSYFFQDEHLAEVIKLSEYNQLMRDTGREEVKLKEGEAAFFSNNNVIMEEQEELLEQKGTYEIYGKQYDIIDYEPSIMSIATTSSSGVIGFGIIMNDDEIPSDAVLQYRYYNMQVKDGANISEVAEDMRNQMVAKNEKVEDEAYYYDDYSLMDREEAYAQNKGMSVIATYAGIYLGIVFLLASAAVLALQQLSKASDNKQRYSVLSKIGTDHKMINKSVFLQLSIYFLIPLILGVIHSVVGINVVNSVVVYVGKVDILFSSTITAIVLLLIYGSYFALTYIGYKNIIKS